VKRSNKCIWPCIEEECNKQHSTCKIVPLGYDKCSCDQTRCRKANGVCVNDKCQVRPPIRCHGRIFGGRCHIRCCKLTSPYIVPYNGGNFKKYCEERCKWVVYRGLGTCFTPPPRDECNPNCVKSGGQCDTNTGRCKCCKDFTGPDARFIGDDIYADYCDVFCEHSYQNKKNELCVNSDYVKRLRSRF